MSYYSSPGSISAVLADPIVPTLIAITVVGLLLVAGLALAGMCLGPKPSMSPTECGKAKRRRFVILFLSPMLVFLCSLIACLSWIGHLDEYIRFYSDATAYFLQVELPALHTNPIVVSGTQENSSSWVSSGPGTRQLSYVYTDVDPQRSPSLPVIFTIPPLLDGNIAIQLADSFVYSLRPSSWPQPKLFRSSVYFQCSPTWTRTNVVIPFLDSSSSAEAPDSSPPSDSGVEECPTGPSGSYALSCAAEGGYLVLYDTPCVLGAFCGYCELYLHLAEVCLYFNPSLEGLSSFEGYCGDSTDGPLYVAGPKPSAITLRLMSIYDPYVVLAQLTNGTRRFNPSYRNARVGMWISAVLGLLWLCTGPALWRKFHLSNDVALGNSGETDTLLATEQQLREERVRLARELPGLVRPSQPRVQHAIRGSRPASRDRPPAPRLVDPSGDDLARTSSQLLAEGHPCQICLARVADVKLLPCNHHCSCRSCTVHLVNKPCPLCRSLVTSMEACDPFAPSFIRLAPEPDTNHGPALNNSGDSDSGPVFESMHSIAQTVEPLAAAADGAPRPRGRSLSEPDSGPIVETDQSLTAPEPM